MSDQLPDKMVEAAARAMSRTNRPEARLALAAAAMPEMLDTLRKCHAVFDVMFAHCLSNGLFNQWGEPMDCTSLNDANRAVENVLRAFDATGVGENDGRA